MNTEQEIATVNEWKYIFSSQVCPYIQNGTCFVGIEKEPCYICLSQGYQRNCYNCRLQPLCVNCYFCRSKYGLPINCKSCLSSSRKYLVDWNTIKRFTEYGNEFKTYGDLITSSLWINLVSNVYMEDEKLDFCIQQIRSEIEARIMFNMRGDVTETFYAVESDVEININSINNGRLDIMWMTNRIDYIKDIVENNELLGNSCYTQESQFWLVRKAKLDEEIFSMIKHVAKIDMNHSIEVSIDENNNIIYSSQPLNRYPMNIYSLDNNDWHSTIYPSDYSDEYIMSQFNDSNDIEYILESDEETDAESVMSPDEYDWLLNSDDEDNESMNTHQISHDNDSSDQD